MLGAGDIVAVTGMSPEEGIEMATSVGVQRRCASRFQWLISLCSAFVLFVGAAPAFAAVSGSAGPIFPPEVNVGQTFPALFVLSNTSGSPCGGPFPSGDPDCAVDINVNSNGIFITPSCASGTGDCDAGSEDPGVFQIIGNGTGGPNSSCPGVIFTPGVPNAITGEVQLTPNAQVHLGPADGSGGAADLPFCVINLTLQTVKLPSIDAVPGAPLQTRQLGLITQSHKHNPAEQYGIGYRVGHDDCRRSRPAGGQDTGQRHDQRGRHGDVHDRREQSGTGTATSVTLDDNLPGPVTWSLAAGSLGGLHAVVANVLHCDLGDLAAGGSVTVVLTAPTTPATCTTYNNNANGGAIAQATNRIDPAALPIIQLLPPVTDPGLITCQPPDLHVNKTPDNGTINAGDTATFTIVVSNSGPGTAKTVTLDDALPGPVTWSLAPGSRRRAASVVANALHCDLGDLASGASVTVVLTAPTTPATCTTYNNNANGGAIADAANSDPVTDPGLITCQPPNLHVVKTPDNGTINAGDTATFTIVVSNTGPGTAKAVTLDDALPGPVTWSLAAGSPSAGTAIPSVANALHCDLGDMAPGASVTVVLTAPTTPATCTVYNNNANGGAIADAANSDPVTDPGLITCQPAEPARRQDAGQR